jgi:DNA polymerase III epsilon subunit-like protein
MICFGAVLVDDTLDKTFYGKLRPISTNFDPEALTISGFTREETQQFDDPAEAMKNFEAWLKENSKGRPVFISDNNGFDWMFICWYFHHFLHRNPFGFSSRRLADLYCGVVKDTFAQWKHLRKTQHTHHPVDDAKGNAEVLLHLKNEMGLNISLK